MVAALAGVSALALFASAAQAEDATVEELVVTAQKREQAINAVPMSITALTNEQMKEKGVDQVSDLARVIPGFFYTQTRVGTPIYSMRGVGFADFAIAGRPTVSIYHDEAPVPFAVETVGYGFDLSRIEVLKGPQGILFGTNSTGGAVNMIANRPTAAFKAGIEAGVGNFGATRMGGYVSGPVNDQMRFRVSMLNTQDSGWQTNYRTGEKMAAQNLSLGRVLFDWLPNDRLTVRLGVNGYIDRSEPQAPQLVEVFNLTSPFAAQVGLPTLTLPPSDSRAADWTSPMDYHRDNKFLQGNLRADYAINDQLMLTSLTSFSHFNEDQTVDIDGTPIVGLEQHTFGKIDSFFQEVRLHGNLTDRVDFVVGANFATDQTHENNFDRIQSTGSYSFVSLGLTQYKAFRLQNDQDMKTYAAFANVDFNVTDALKLSAGARYTRADNDFGGCSADAGDGITAAVYTGYSRILRGRIGLAPLPNPILPGGCFTMDEQYVPMFVHKNLNEDNVAWRLGADWTIRPDTMVYANVSQGYKAGGFSSLSATTQSQYDPAVQEKLMAYEAGFKIRVLPTLQVNGAIYRYDYDNKQVLGIVPDPALTRLLKLINIPKSHVDGAELQVGWYPIEGLTLSANSSYVDSEIDGAFIAYNPLAVLTNFGGEPFPHTPKWQHQFDVGYKWPVAQHYAAFVGGSYYVTSSTNTELGRLPRLAKPGYFLLDLRAGLEGIDKNWKLMGWVRNATDEQYWTYAARTGDVYNRMMGKPRTFGVTLTYDFE
jgi:outer membrane receptor protein involved in Fe transport